MADAMKLAEVIETLEGLLRGPRNDDFDRGAWAARLDALDMLRPLAAALATREEAPAEAGFTADSLRSVSDETMRALLSCKDVGSGRAHLARILNALRAQPAPASSEADRIKRACIAWHEAKPEDPFSVLYKGSWCGSFPHQIGPERWTFTVPAMTAAINAALAAPPSPDADKLKVAVEALERIRSEAYAWTPSKAAFALGQIAHQALTAQPAGERR